MEKLKKMPMPGYRVIKTAVCVVLCLICYKYLERDGLLLAIMAAVFSMLDSVEKSLQSGKNRIIGTLVGGFFGTVFVTLKVQQLSFLLFLICIFLGTIIFFHICNITGMNQASAIGVLVFLTIVIDGETSLTPISFSINRIIDTLVGIAIAVGVNISMFRPKPERMQSAEIPILTYDIRRAVNFKNMKWSGGTSHEIFIYPEDTFYSEKDFDFRVSTANTEIEDCTFTKLDGYLRHTMLLEGKMHLFHKGYHDVNLGQYEQDIFKGKWDTYSKGKCIDLNLMMKKGYTGGLYPVRMGVPCELNTKDYAGFYFVENNVKITVKDEFDREFTETADKGDYFMIEYPKGYAVDYRVEIEWDTEDFDRVLAIKVECMEEDE